MAAAVIEANLTEIDGATLRRNSPEDVREVFETELGGFLEILEFGVDLRAIAFVFDFSLAQSGLHQFRTLKIELGGATGAAEIDGLGGLVECGGNRRVLHSFPTRRSRRSG